MAGNATSVKASDRDPRGVDVKGRRDTSSPVKGGMGFEGASLLDGLTNTVTSFMFESHLFVACMRVRVCVRAGV